MPPVALPHTAQVEQSAKTQRLKLFYFQSSRIFLATKPVEQIAGAGLESEDPPVDEEGFHGDSNKCHHPPTPPTQSLALLCKFVIYTPAVLPAEEVRQSANQQRSLVSDIYYDRKWVKTNDNVFEKHKSVKVMY